MDKKLKIAWDIDDTLIVPAVATGFRQDTPAYDTIHIYQWFQFEGNHMILWSGGGMDYTKMWADKLGIRYDEIRVKQKYDDVDMAFDDCDVDLAKINIKVKRLNNGVSRKDWNKHLCTGSQVTSTSATQI